MFFCDFPNNHLVLVRARKRNLYSEIGDWFGLEKIAIRCGEYRVEKGEIVRKRALGERFLEVLTLPPAIAECRVLIMTHSLVFFICKDICHSPPCAILHALSLLTLATNIYLFLSLTC